MIRYVARYLELSTVYGFYRGWNADSTYNKYTIPSITPSVYTLSTEKYMIKTARASVNACLYGTVGNIFALYRLICRTEVWIMDKDPYEHPYAYTEVFDSITLSPKTIT
jgi:hypothetical protein